APTCDGFRPLHKPRWRWSDRVAVPPRTLSELRVLKPCRPWIVSSAQAAPARCGNELRDDSAVATKPLCIPESRRPAAPGFHTLHLTLDAARANQERPRPASRSKDMRSFQTNARRDRALRGLWDRAWSIPTRLRPLYHPALNRCR